MPEHKAVVWSSPANAWAIGAQILSLMIPVLSVVEVYQPVAIEAISKPLADAWQWALFITALIALLASLLMRSAAGNGNRMRSVIRVEGTATAVVAICYVLLWSALVREYGWGTAPLTQLLVGGLGAIATIRVAQILWELRKYRLALAAGHVTSTEAIAQPKET